ncbi:MAG: TrmH family RNA methyltransferase [Candidatus Promineifilaceae bacterium]|jgi:TrmH family RNA methyltransferase
MISSLANPQVKRIRRLQKNKRYRYREQAFVVEGTRLFQELAVNPERPKTTFYTQDWLADAAHEAIIAEKNLAGEVVTNEVMAAMSDTESASGVLAVTSMSPIPLPDQPSMVLILDAITTPGNLGTMLRTAGAARVDAVLLAPDCVDPYNPKVVRGAMGAHFRLPIQQLDWQEIIAYCHSLKIWVSEAAGGEIYTRVDWRQPSALIVGNEARGAGSESQKAAHGSVVVPMAGGTESLNAATASAVILYEALRQRNFFA